MSDQGEKARRFAELHVPGSPLLLPNPWDVGSARILAHLGFQALATTSGGHAATLGRLDGAVTRDETLEHAAAIVAATDLPVSCDFEKGFADDPDGVAASVTLAAATGLAGLSIEDYTGDPATPRYDTALAAERVAAAVEAAHTGGVHLVVTARCENYLRGNPDLADTIARLQAYQEAGADVLYAPFMTAAEEIGHVVAALDRPVNVLALPGVPTVPELAELGVARVSVGAAFALAGIDTLVTAAKELMGSGTYGYFDAARRGMTVRDEAFGP